MVNQVEMDEMVVMESLDLVDLKAGMARWDHRGRKVTWENVDLLDPGVQESLMSVGVELPARTQMELNLSMLDELLEVTTFTKEELMITSVYHSSLSTLNTNQVSRDIPLYMVLSMRHTVQLMITMSPVLSAIPLSESQS